MKICEMNPSVRPYERLEEFGAEALSDEELLAILVRSGTKGRSARDIASDVLSQTGLHDGLPGLSRITLEELSELEGIGRVKAILIKACVEIGRRCAIGANAMDKVQFLSSDMAKTYFSAKMSFLESEEVHVVLLDSKKHMIVHEVVSKGGLNRISFISKELFRLAVRVNAAGLIIAHNHPSGDPVPSEEDVETTQDLIRCGLMIGIEVLDHIVVGRGVATSMKESGFISEKKIIEKENNDENR
ncbi:MAG: DNA repair protein RadC [Clostridiales bacterium]|nr:DNA repair protein RadC [Clostridiales bacterium]